MWNGSAPKLFEDERDMINAERILRALDRRLDHEISLVIYGRAAIALGFENPPEATTHTLDVDGIIPVSQAAHFRADGNFWDAQDMADIAFLIHHDRLTPVQIEGAFAEAVIPDLAELRDACERAKPLVRALARPTAH